MSHEPIELGRYADLCATLHHYRAEAESAVLEASGVSPGEWAVSDAYWTEELSVAYRRRNETAAYEFSTRYAKMRRRLARHGVPVGEALATLVTRPKPKGEQGGAEARDGAAPSTSQIPTYLLEQQQRVAAPTPAPQLSPVPQAVMSPAAMQAAPRSPVTPPPMSVPQPGRAPGELRQDMRQAVPMPAAGASLTGPSPAGPSPAGPGPAGPGPAGSGGLPAVAPKPAFAQGTSMTFEAPRQALPFREGAASPAVANPQAPAAPKAAAPGTGTAFLPDPRDAPPPSLGAAGLGPVSVGPEGRPAPPTEAMPMTVEHYAAMVAEIHGKPGQDEAVLKRYGIQSAEERARVQRAMTAHLRADPALRAKYEALLQRFAAWMR